uniref:MARVEL domain-containing protein n=1 Tax=Timema genevievae TaxID=629358 RepID=A0A7R9PQD1_TIMGE|nr:unnamed protein product [Timema genevievae]
MGDQYHPPPATTAQFRPHTQNPANTGLKPFFFTSVSANWPDYSQWYLYPVSANWPDYSQWYLSPVSANLPDYNQWYLSPVSANWTDYSQLLSPLSANWTDYSQWFVSPVSANWPDYSQWFVSPVSANWPDYSQWFVSPVSANWTDYSQWFLFPVSANWPDYRWLYKKVPGVENTPLSSRESNLDLPVISNILYCESSVLGRIASGGSGNVFGIVCMACASPAILSGTHWFLFVVVTSFIATLIWVFVYLLGIREALKLPINWILTVSTLLELVNTSILTLLYLIAFIVQLSVWSPYYRSSWRNSNMAAGNGTVLKIGRDFNVFNWKAATGNILKKSNHWHFRFAVCKRFIITQGSTPKSDTLVRGEVSYNTDVGMSRKALRPNRKTAKIDPQLVKIGVPVKQIKKDDVKRLLQLNYGEDRENLPDLQFYRDIIFSEMVRETGDLSEDGNEGRLMHDLDNV